MRDYGRVSTSLWRSRKFKTLRETGDDQARLLYLYLHTCPQANSIGCFVLPKGYATSDLGWSESVLDRAMQALCEASLTSWNGPEELVRIVDFIEHSPMTNGKHAAGASKLALSLPDCREKLYTINDLLADNWAKDDAKLRAAAIGLSEAFDTTETETETERRKRSTASPVECAFVGKVVRLNPPDFAAWQKAYRHLDLMAELTARDAWLASEEATDEDRRKWFITTSRWLANRNAEAAAKGLTPKGAQKPRPQADDWAKDLDLG